MFHGPNELLAVVKEHPVMNDRNIGLLGQLATIPSGGFKNDVVALPNPGSLGGITQAQHYGRPAWAANRGCRVGI